MRLKIRRTWNFFAIGQSLLLRINGQPVEELRNGQTLHLDSDEESIELSLSRAQPIHIRPEDMKAKYVRVTFNNLVILISFSPLIFVFLLQYFDLDKHVSFAFEMAGILIIGLVMFYLLRKVYKNKTFKMTIKSYDPE